MKYTTKFLLIGLITLSLAACTRTVSRMSTPPEDALVVVSQEQIDLSDDLDYASLDLAIDRSIKYYEGSGQKRVYRIADKLTQALKIRKTR